jgi:hypothetical protein
MAIVIALGIAMAVVAFVAAPFFFGGDHEARSAGDSDLASVEFQDLLAEKETLYAAIQELDFDLQSGKLSTEDHRALRQRQEERAAVLLQQIDAAQGTVAKPEAPRKARREKRRG